MPAEPPGRGRSSARAPPPSTSGFGEAACREFAAAGYDIFGVHLDRKQGLAHVAEIVDAVVGQKRRAHFFNINAADPDKRRETIASRRRAA